MFENAQNKKNEAVDDIFADTDTTSKESEANEVSMSAPKEEKSKPEETSTNKEEEKIPEKSEEKSQDLKKTDQDADQEGSNSSWFKPVIIGTLIIILAVSAYFLFGFFYPDIDNGDLAIDSPDLVSDDVFDPSSPDTIDPSLIIRDQKEEDIVELEPELADEPELEFEDELEPVDQDFEIEQEIEEVNLLEVSFVDSDDDGLSDLAEEFIGTDSNNSDSDGNGFSDYEEIINGYNPLGDGLLPDNFPAAIYKENGLSFLYPSNWLIEERDSNTWLLIAPDNASIKLEREYSEAENIFTWYQEENNDFSWIGEERQIVNKDMQTAIISLDGSKIYLLSNKTNYLFSISLEVNESNNFEHFSQLALFVNTLIQE